MSASIQFSKEEAQANINLIDAAVKALGLAAAEAGLVITKKLQAAFVDKPKLEVVPEVQPQEVAS